MEDFYYDVVGRKHTLSGVAIPSVTQVIGWFSWLGQRPRDDERLAYAAAKGQAVHSACEAYDLRADGEDVIADPIIMPYLDGWREFVMATGVRFKSVELTGVNRTYRYCGRIDRITDDGMIIDIKTGSFDRNAYVQMSAYSHMDGVAETIRVAIVVLLDGEGGYTIKEQNKVPDRELFSVFTAMLKTKNWLDGGQ